MAVVGTSSIRSGKCSSGADALRRSAHNRTQRSDFAVLRLLRLPAFAKIQPGKGLLGAAGSGVSAPQYRRVMKRKLALRVIRN